MHRRIALLLPLAALTFATLQGAAPPAAWPGFRGPTANGAAGDAAVVGNAMFIRTETKLYKIGK